VEWAVWTIKSKANRNNEVREKSRTFLLYPQLRQSRLLDEGKSYSL
jgi:hypothetical protein